MVGSKITRTRILGMITDKLHPYILFSSNRVPTKKHVGMLLICYHPYYSCWCTFWPYHPYLVIHFLVAFYTCVTFLIVYRRKHRWYGKWATVEWLIWSSVRSRQGHAPGAGVARLYAVRTALSMHTWQQMALYNEPSNPPHYNGRSCDKIERTLHCAI